MSRIPAFLLALVVQTPVPTCLPAFWGGVLAGSTNRSEVERLYGRGLYLEDEGGYPASYYRDASGSITLHVIYGTDTFVETLEVIRGNAIPAAARQDPNAVSASLQRPFVFGGLGGLSFGASAEAVRSNMGEPSEEHHRAQDEITLVYRSRCSCELAAGVSFVVRDGHLVKVSYWANQGSCSSERSGA